MGSEKKLSWLFRIVMVAIALNLLAIKISIVLEININSSSSTGRVKAPATSKFFQNSTNKSYFSY